MVTFPNGKLHDVLLPEKDHHKLLMKMVQWLGVIGGTYSLLFETLALGALEI